MLDLDEKLEFEDYRRQISADSVKDLSCYSCGVCGLDVGKLVETYRFIYLFVSLGRLLGVGDSLRLYSILTLGTCRVAVWLV